MQPKQRASNSPPWHGGEKSLAATTWQRQALYPIFDLVLDAGQQRCRFDRYRCTLSGVGIKAVLRTLATGPSATLATTCAIGSFCNCFERCGRSFDEVKHWTDFGPGDKRAVWRRITQDGTAWRFNRYAERAATPTQAQAPRVDTGPPAGSRR